MADCTGPENRSWGNLVVSSNPTASANIIGKMTDKEKIKYLEQRVAELELQLYRLKKEKDEK